MALRLKQRMYLQFFIAVLPLAIVFAVQMLSTNDLPARVDKIMGIYDLSLQSSAIYKNFLNGLVDAVEILGKARGMATVRLTNVDVVRHSLVTRILEAYGKSDDEKRRRQAGTAPSRKAGSLKPRPEDER